MEGQWIGKSVGSNPGTIVLELEPRAGKYEGAAFLFEQAADLPGSMIRITTEDQGEVHLIDAVPVPLWRDGAIIFPQDFAAAFPGVNFPTKASIKLEKSGNRLCATWSTDAGTSGDVELLPSDASKPSALEPIANVAKWDDFKRYALNLSPRDFIFRGQSANHRLRTSFHRTWRKDLGRYVLEDIDQLRLALAGMTRHFFRHDSPAENAAFYSLLQHHGYPTPLLDWSYSPFVAAFFAFDRKHRSPGDGDSVRIFILDKTAWRADWKEYGNVAYTPPHFTVMDILALDNPRSIPQQALSTVTNCDDIESFVTFCEGVAAKKYLWCVDLPFDERHVVLAELTAMGITAGSLFPGLDGACEQVRRRLFGPDV